jgi:RNA polymerase sigma factor (sigma-70 family)
MPPTTLSGESRIRSTAGELHAGTLSCESLLHQSDERLVALTRAGSERAFAEITRRYQRALRVYCSRLVGPERAQDAVQQALLQAFLSLRDRAPREIALRPWLYRIAHNCAIDQIRMGSWEHEQLDLEFDGVAQPPALLEQKEELRSLIAGMRRLPDAQRQALTLRELEGCSYEEISARLGHTGSGVRQLIFRARTALRKGALALLPFGVVRDRLAGTAVEAHQVAGIAAVPASSAGATETLSAAALAVVAVLGGVAGGTRGGDHHRRATAVPAALTAGSMASAASRTQLTAPLAIRDPRPARRSGRARGPVAVQPQAPAPVLQQVVPPVVPAPPAPPQPVALQVAAPVGDQGAQVLPAPSSTPDGAATGVQQQSLASQPAGSRAGLTQSPPPGSQNGPVTDGPVTAPPVPPTQGAAAPQAGLVKPGTPVTKRPPAVKRPPAKPVTPAAPPSGPGSRPGINPKPAPAPGRAQKAPAATAKPVPPKQKKNGPAATRVAKPL